MTPSFRPRLDEWAESRGYRAGWYGSDAVHRAVTRISGLRDAGEFDETFYSRCLSWLDGQGTGIEAGESLITVAVPRPAHIASFDYRGRSLDLALPPTYHNFSAVFTEVRADLEAFAGDGLGLRGVRGPLKALAAETSLARYGKNNIAYVEGLGSYVQLLAFACSLPVEDAAVAADAHSVPEVLDRCARCRLCEKACPEGAIDPQRFLLHAERCLTLYSEFEGELPEAFGSVGRACLVGCMACQEICPENRGLLRLERLQVHFTEEETGYLLHGRPGDLQPPHLRKKVETLRCSDCTLTAGGVADPRFRRNLGAVLGRLAGR